MEIGIDSFAALLPDPETGKRRAESFARAALLGLPLMVAIIIGRSSISTAKPDRAPGTITQS